MCEGVKGWLVHIGLLSRLVYILNKKAPTDTIFLISLLMCICVFQMSDKVHHHVL